MEGKKLYKSSTDKKIAEMFTDHAVTVYGSLKKGLKATNIEG